MCLSSQEPNAEMIQRKSFNAESSGRWGEPHNPWALPHTRPHPFPKSHTKVCPWGQTLCPLGLGKKLEVTPLNSKQEVAWGSRPQACFCFRCDLHTLSWQPQQSSEGHVRGKLFLRVDAALPGRACGFRDAWIPLSALPQLFACGEITGRLWACVSLGCSNTNSAGSFHTWHRCLQLTRLGGMQPLCCQATLPISLGNF